MTLTVETWCEALDSGRYQQGREQLRIGDRFCCLGVACDLSGVGEWSTSNFYYVGGNPSHQFLPVEIEVALGLENEEGMFLIAELPAALRQELKAFGYERQVHASLVGMNDAGVPFPLIAKVIRARPKGLFREAA
jgi:hypothetical protein